jgi:uracil-DNA glycosylase
LNISQPLSNVNSPKTEDEKRLAERIENNRVVAKMKLEAKATRGLCVDIGISWYKAFEKEFSKEYFQKVFFHKIPTNIKEIIPFVLFYQLAYYIADEREKGVVIYPPPHHVFTFTRMCELNEVKVVILGQDPYHGPNQAHGLCFSVRKGIPAPPRFAHNLFSFN